MPIDDSSMTFYATAAQIIPVLFVALAFELRSHSFLPAEVVDLVPPGIGARRLQIFGALFTLSVIFALVLGEGAALIGMTHGHELRFQIGHTAWFVATALTLGGFGVATPVFVRQLFDLLPFAPGASGSEIYLRVLLFTAGALVSLWLVVQLLLALIN